MKISQVKEAAKLAFKSDLTLNLVGVSGAGKTSIWKQIYKELGFDNLIIIRPALFADAADLIGLPDFVTIEKDGKEVKTTRFITPDYLPKDGDKTLIVLDEINRIQKDIANAIFGLIEAEGPTVGQYHLPKTCKVVATCNPPTSKYSGVLDLMDQAWITRMCFVKVMPDIESFIDYARSTKRVSEFSINFYREHPRFFGMGEDFEVDMFQMDLINNNRAKEKADAVMTHGLADQVDESVLFEMLRGLGGLEFAQMFLNFSKDYYKATTGKDVLSNAKDVLNTFDFTKMSEVSKIVDEVNVEIDAGNITDENFPNLCTFLMKLPEDIFVGVIARLVKLSGDTSIIDKVDMYVTLHNRFEFAPDELKERLTRVLPLIQL